jgi:hypothetical protein
MRPNTPPLTPPNTPPEKSYLESRMRTEQNRGYSPDTIAAIQVGGMGYIAHDGRVALAGDEDATGIISKLHTNEHNLVEANFRPLGMDSGFTYVFPKNELIEKALSLSLASSDRTFVKSNRFDAARPDFESICAEAGVKKASAYEITQRNGVYNVKFYNQAGAPDKNYQIEKDICSPKVASFEKHASLMKRKALGEILAKQIALNRICVQISKVGDGPVAVDPIIKASK